ncbi:MAG: DUF951 domain-containing protein [Ardenticatenaceae bacterium]|nr:DUF951 domain-containing protein [Ardenticatenaceae bacterium]HBY97639.1 DUF951 domain-containing protein [Chloroflexota bacterium]
MTDQPTPIAVGERVQLRKQHPCGGDVWEVVRIGADIGLVCLTCGRRILLDRRTFNKRLKRRLSAPQTPDTPRTP